MFAIDDPTAVAVLPTPEAAGTPGFWTEGNPGLGQAATLMKASFFNGLQQELLNILAAASITPSKTTYTQLTSAIAVLAKGRLIARRVFTTGGTYTPTAGTAFVDVTVVGGGGGGGSAAPTAAGQCSAGAGGGGGGWAKKRIASSFSGVTMTIGAGGGASTTGGTTSFGALISATGGGGGAAGGGASSANITINGYTTGGVGSGGDLNGVGGHGNFAFYAVTPVSGMGGFSLLGEGAGYVNTTTTINGLNAVAPGAGGSGAANGASQAGAAVGGSGANGLIIVEEYA